jgi:cysteine desulfurase
MAPRRPIYLDHHATTPLDPRVLEAMMPFLTHDFGNAASKTHVFGWRAESAVEDARERIASAIAATARDIVFTSGATESNNTAIIGAARAAGAVDAVPGSAPRRDHIITLATEHRAVLDPCAWLETRGLRVTRLEVDAEGLVDPQAVADAIGDRTLLVSIMLANSEIGVLQDIAAIGAICRDRGVMFHSDAAQAVGRIPVDVEAMQIDLLSISFHKIYGPKGAGALYVRSRRPRAKLAPILFGGGHERGLRPGTLAVPLIVGGAAALDLCVAEQEVEAKRLRELRDRLWARLSEALPGARLNGHRDKRLAGNLNVSFPGVDAARLLLALSDIAISSGSACSSADPEPSHVLAAIGLPEALSRASLRFGLGRGTTAEEVEQAAERVVEEVRAERVQAAEAAGTH